MVPEIQLSPGKALEQQDLYAKLSYLSQILPYAIDGNTIICKFSYQSPRKNPRCNLLTNMTVNVSSSWPLSTNTFEERIHLALTCPYSE